MKNLEYYLSLNYKIELNPISEEDGDGWLSSHPELNGCMADGESPEEAILNLKEAKELWLMTAIQRGLTIPEPKSEKEDDYSGKFTLRIPKKLHKAMAESAQREGVSLNQYVMSLLSYYQGQKTMLLEMEKILSGNVRNSIHVVMGNSHKSVDLSKSVRDMSDDWDLVTPIGQSKFNPFPGGNKRW